MTDLHINGLQNYLDTHSSAELPVLQKLTRETHLKVLMPNMLSGHTQGLVLQMLSLIISPNRILEIGTFTGYSAICLATGLKPDGILYTIDINEELELIQNKYFNDAHLKHKIKQLYGNAIEIIPTINEVFDIIFIDADKQNYSNYLDLCTPKLKTGGCIIADNVLWSGKVLNNEPDKDTQALINFTQKILSNPNYITTILPIRDGLLLAVKK